jgi:Primase C terminal 2 (PriCT-2)/Bifunctional DNA primase/polymerase, N-terminal
MIETLPRFPCKLDKSPLTRWRNSASRDVDDTDFPLVGVLTGSPSGFDVLDVDIRGLDWFASQHLPLTRMHQTRSGGIHCFFRHAQGLRNSTSRIANGVDVRAEGGMIVWWAREGLPVCEAPIAEWPPWLLRLAFGRKRNDLGSERNQPTAGGDGADGAVAAYSDPTLAKLDPTEYRDFDTWVRLMMAAHAAGISREDWIKWSTSDPVYADHGETIARLWNGLRADGGITAQTLFWELREPGRLYRSIHEPIDEPIDDGHGPDRRMVPVTADNHSIHRPVTAETANKAKFEPTRNLKHRVTSILRMVEREATDDWLFRGACMLAEMIAVEKKLKPSVAWALLKSACQLNGLWRDRAKCEATINAAFRKVELKYLEVSDEQRR